MARTLLDIQLSRLLYPLLIELATAQQILTYGQLIERAQARYPDDQRVANLIPVRMGRILWVIYDFVAERDLPRLTLIIVSAGNQYPGSAMWQHDCPAEQHRCFAFDWSTVDQAFDLYGQHSEKTVTPLRRIPREKAKQLMAAHFHDPANVYPSGIRTLREAIIENIMNGLSVEEAFQIETQLLTPTTQA
ncbi:hypothetical protein B0D71_18445 [Pseudomonas laurylsulfativorans]|uniref:Uncharacterized protein n=1 Tax=Pseudomonas laurylsulfativorans TaxID=1943631 RepID=A0A2S3VMP1_9PSED|nr:hypothetical protein [Pseudomonas laurylsulfativorans]POF41212.1 hypothetical protein B0D71_18445 [Pseudomonas laurylsulfativorans]